jgi:hypothetical protein
VFGADNEVGCRPLPYLAALTVRVLGKFVVASAIHVIVKKIDGNASGLV